jgi:hypothetical protein
MQCTACGALLQLGRSRGERWRSRTALLLASLGLFAGGLFVYSGSIARAMQQLGRDAGIVEAPRAERRPGSVQELRLRRSGMRDRVVAAIDPRSAITRNLAARVAAEDQGPFHVGQVASVWSHVRQRWSYVNDPRGAEYVVRASDSIENGFVGDCDDFAIVLVAMIESVGGDARVVISDGERGSHAYAEACIESPPEQVANDLDAHYRRERGSTEVREVHYRSDASCPVWLNLDWSAAVPGGSYGREHWAVAIHADGKTETLAPAVAAPDQG